MAVAPIRTESHGTRRTRLVIDGRFLLQDVTGVQRVSIGFLTALDQLLSDGVFPGLAVDLVVPARGELVSTPRLDAVRLRRFGRLRGHSWEQLELPAACGSDPLLCLGNVAPARLLLRRRPRVHTMVHDLSYRYFPEAYSRPFRIAYSTLMPLVLQRSARVFTVSSSERDAIRLHYPRLDPARLVAVQNGGGEGAATTRPSAAPDALQVGAPTVAARSLREASYLYVGSLTRRKNAAGLLAAAVELVRTRDATFTFVGSTNSSFEGPGLAVPDDVRARIRFLGQVNDADVVERAYRRSAVLVFPSFYEASPLPPIEAMRFGCPVVAADIASLRERCGDAALYCDPGDVGSIVSTARRLARTPRLWEHHQLRGLHQAARFTWSAQVRSVVGCIVAG